jgi:hypothetical protein
MYVGPFSELKGIPLNFLLYKCKKNKDSRIKLIVEKCKKIEREVFFKDYFLNH